MMTTGISSNSNNREPWLKHIYRQPKTFGYAFAYAILFDVTINGIDITFLKVEPSLYKCAVLGIFNKGYI